MRNLIAFVCLWLGLVLQSTLFEIPPFHVIHPNFILVVLVVAALTRGPRAAMVLGVLIGFIQDATFGSFLGLYAFTYGLIGYFASAAFAQFLHKNVAITFLVTITCTFVDVWVTYGMTRLFDVTTETWTSLLSTSLSLMIQNGLLLLVLFPVLTRWLSDRARTRYRTSDGEAG